MPRPFPVPFRGRARGSAQGRRNVPQTLGGVGQIEIGGVGQAPPSFTAGVVRVCGTRPDDPSRASGEGRDGSDPPFSTAGAVRRVGGGAPTPPAKGGSLPSYVSLQEGSPARVRAGRSATPRRAMLDALVRAFLVIGGVSAACAWTWPGAFPEGDPVAVLVRYHTPNFYAAVVVWYYVAPGVAALLAGQFLISTSRIWFARMGVSLGLRSSLPPWPLSPTGGRPRDRRRGSASPGQSHREPGPRMADDPRAWTLYRRGDLRRGRLRQNVGLYAPVRPPALRLASRRIPSADRPRSSLK